MLAILLCWALAQTPEFIGQVGHSPLHTSYKRLVVAMDRGRILLQGMASGKRKGSISTHLQPSSSNSLNRRKWKKSERYAYLKSCRWVLMVVGGRW
jgi:hypothetical protein